MVLMMAGMVVVVLLAMMKSLRRYKDIQLKHKVLV